MNWNELAAKLTSAWDLTAEERPDLFADIAHEDAVRGQFVKRLRVVFGTEYDIDENFNVMNYPDGTRGIKRIKPGEADTGRIAIDVVIHHPGSDESASNLLALELKKKTANRDWPDDIAKLTQVTSAPLGLRSFQYSYGLLIRYRPTALFSHAILFRNGLRSELNTITLL